MHRRRSGECLVISGRKPKERAGDKGYTEFRDNQVQEPVLSLLTNTKREVEEISAGCGLCESICFVSVFLSTWRHF